MIDFKKHVFLFFTLTQLFIFVFLYFSYAFIESDIHFVHWNINSEQPRPKGRGFMPKRHKLF